MWNFHDRKSSARYIIKYWNPSKSIDPMTTLDNQNLRIGYIPKCLHVIHFTKQLPMAIINTKKSQNSRSPFQINRQLLILPNIITYCILPKILRTVTLGAEVKKLQGSRSKVTWKFAFASALENKMDMLKQMIRDRRIQSLAHDAKQYV